MIQRITTRGGRITEAACLGQMYLTRHGDIVEKGSTMRQRHGLVPYSTSYCTAFGRMSFPLVGTISMGHADMTTITAISACKTT